MNICPARIVLSLAYSAIIGLAASFHAGIGDEPKIGPLQSPAA
jgi:hypothetical protein